MQNDTPTVRALRARVATLEAQLADLKESKRVQKALLMRTLAKLEQARCAQ